MSGDGKDWNCNVGLASLIERYRATYGANVKPDISTCKLNLVNAYTHMLCNMQSDFTAEIYSSLLVPRPL